MARVETVIEEHGHAGRRVLPSEPARPVGVERSPARAHSRFDVQLSQGLPFLGALTRADWDVLVAVRNLYYEASEGAILDEMAVSNPPKRVLGGIAVRF